MLLYVHSACGQHNPSFACAEGAIASTTANVVPDKRSAASRMGLLRSFNGASFYENADVEVDIVASLNHSGTQPDSEHLLDSPSMDHVAPRENSKP